MRKLTPANITGGMFSQNFKETIKKCIALEEAFSFMNSIKDTPACWKKVLNEVLATVKHLCLPTFLLKLSCADLRWNELI